MRRTASTILLALFLAVGCGDDDGPAEMDAGAVPDAGGIDAGSEPEDAGETVEDGGPTVADAGQQDAGETADANVADAGDLLDCEEFTECLDACGSETCTNGCVARASEGALTLFQAVQDCGLRECAPDYQNECVQAQCAAEITACVEHRL